MRKPLKILLVLVVVLLIVAASLPLWIDSVAKSAVETGATSALGVETKLAKIDIAIFGGECTLGGLQVANPEGFDTPHFFKLDGGFLSVSLGTLMEDKVVIPELTLDGIDLNLERKGGRSNYGVILDNLETGEKEPAAEGGKKFVIETVTVRNIRVQTKIQLVKGVQPGVKVTVPEIVLRNVGSGSEGGVVLRDVIDQVLKGILKGVLDSGVDLGGDITKELKKGLAGIGAIGVDVVGEGTEGVADAIGGLLGKGKK